MRKFLLSVAAAVLLSSAVGCSSDRYTTEAAMSKVNEYIAAQEQTQEEEPENVYALATIYWDLKDELKNSCAVERLCQFYNDLYFARNSGYSLLNMTEVQANDYTTEWYYNYNDSSTLKCTDEAGSISVEAYHWDNDILSEEEKESLYESFRDEAVRQFGDDLIVDNNSKIMKIDNKTFTFDIFENNIIKVTLQ